MRNSVKKQYGDWVSWLQQVEVAIKEDGVSSDTITIIVGGKAFPFDHKQFQQACNNAWKQTKHDHPDVTKSSWATSFFKRFWGCLKSTENNRKDQYKQKQLNHIDYLRSKV